EVVRVHQGANFGLRIAWQANADVLGALRELGNEIIVDIALYQHAGAGGAALAVQREDTEDGGIQGCFQISVGEDDCWGLAAQFQGQALELRGCSGGDGGAGGGVAGEGNQWHIRVLDQVVAGNGTGTEDQVEDAFWKAGLAEDFWPQSCGERGVACRLQDYRVSGSDGRS